MIMRRFEKEITDPGVIEDILLHSPLCRIGLVDGDEAYIVPMNYGYHNGSLWFHSAPHGRKIELIRKNSLVTFEITRSEELVMGKMACDWTSRYRSVMGRGRMEIIADKEAKKEGLDVIMRKYGAEGELVYRDSSLDRMVILKLNIDDLSAKQSE
jgi:hypothetical protein